MSTTVTYPLRLPRSIKAAAEQLAKTEGVSLNQLVATAVAEKLAVLNTAAFLPNGATAPIWRPFAAS